jgi:2-hydroxychromene-2-carboxylate isomerase
MIQGMPMPKHVDFYFALNSRYSYLASTQIAALERDCGAEVAWRPLDFDLLMVARKWDPFSGAPTSGQYDVAYRRKDVARWADYYGIAVRIVEWERYDWLRFNLAAMEAAKETEGCARFAQAVFALTMGARDGQDTESVIASAAHDAGVDPRRLIEASKSSDTKAKLHHAVTDAVALGVFGVPSFVVDDEVYWGNDRIALLRWRLTGQR